MVVISSFLLLAEGRADPAADGVQVSCQRALDRGGGLG